jgi:N-acetylated-alpha-linked acidic dipeptidase
MLIGYISHNLNLSPMWKASLLPLLCIFTSLAWSQTKTVAGFTKESVSAQLAAEEKFDSYLKAENLDQWMKRLSARPHHLGSDYGRQNAEFIRDQFRSWGFEAEIETFQVLFPTPKLRLLEMTAPTRYKAKLEEPALKEDATSGQSKNNFPYTMRGHPMEM